jgi:L-aminopeptidase/D-esterase-like protein
MSELVYLTGSDAQLPQGFLIGNAQDFEAGTGCTAIVCKEGATASVKVLGGGPATRETDLLNPENMVDAVHAVVLSGGSTFGLEASTGAVHYLESKAIGLAFSDNVIPIVVGASIYDLEVGNGQLRPDAKMGYAATEAAFTSDGSIEVGGIGAGCGASVGKFLGARLAMNSGLGIASITVGELIIAAVVVVNAIGNVYDRKTGNWLAGVLDPTSLGDKPRIFDPYAAIDLMVNSGPQNGAVGGNNSDDKNDGDIGNNSASSISNTTIGCILTNAAITKPQAAKVALMSHDGYARSIEPVHTSFDGDAIFCMAHGTVAAQQDFVGALAAQTMEQAVHNAVLSAKSAYGLIAQRDL